MDFTVGYEDDSGSDARMFPPDLLPSKLIDDLCHHVGHCKPTITPVDAAVPDAPLPPDAAPEAQPDAGSGRTPEEQHVYQLCQRVGLAFCEKFDQCGLQSLASCQGDFDEICAMSYRVRGEDALVDMCLPWIQTITCQQLIDPSFNLDPSCYHQFRGR